MYKFGVVSILTGSEEPVQLHCSLHHARRGAFQSSPAPKSRCNWARRSRPAWATSFNPHRLRRAGATSDQSQVPAVPPVSILTGSEEPVQQHIWGPVQVNLLFQSSPAPKSRCNSKQGKRGNRCSMFQSSPAPKSRCNCCGGGTDRLTACFNPHRLRRAGATLRGPRPWALCPHVSILTGSEEPVQREGGRWIRDPWAVSILTGSEEPVQPFLGETGEWRLFVSILTGSEEPVQPVAP